MGILLIVTLAYITGTLITFLLIGKNFINNISKSKNKVHFYVARDLDGSLWIFIGKPFRETNIFNARIPGSCTRLSDKNVFKYFGLNKNDYDNIRWEDEPVEVFLNVED